MAKILVPDAEALHLMEIDTEGETITIVVAALWPGLRTRP